MELTKHRADILQGYMDEGLDAVKAIRRFKIDHPEYTPKHIDGNGDPVTFEAIVSRLIRVEKMTPDRAVRVASARNPRAIADYYRRLAVGAAADLDYVCEGKPL